MNVNKTPKSGFLFEWIKLPKLGGVSISIGFAKEPKLYCYNGYEEPPTHEGFEVYFYAILLRRQLTTGYTYVKEVEA